MNTNSITAYRAHYNTENPKTNKEKILATMYKHRRPLTYDQISEYSGVDLSACGQYIGRDLINEKLVYKLKHETGKSKKGNKASLYITRKYLHENKDACPPVENDPRNPIEYDQLKMF